MGKYILVFMLLLLSACEAEVSYDDQSKEGPIDISVPDPGTVVLSDSMPIPDPLNEISFSVKLVASEYIRQGTYDVKVLYGHNDAQTQITFPRGRTKKVIPVMKKAAEPFAYIIGFHYGEDDPTFYEYYLVKGAQGKIEMKYLKAYSFQ